MNYFHAVVQKRIIVLQSLAEFSGEKSKKLKVLVDVDRLNLFKGVLSGAHSASAPDTGSALKATSIS
jgi:hypothetical protein